MSILIKPLLERIKNLREFEVDVDIPEGFHFAGVVPFDVTISQNRGKFKVLASTFVEAQEKVENYIKKNTTEE